MNERCEQTKHNACKAALAERLHANNRCPGNYLIDYRHGWFYLVYGPEETEHFQDPELTARAEELLEIHKETGEDTILFSTVWNTYVVNTYVVGR